MSFSRCIDTAIIIPARNEAKRIETCLAALAPQCNERVQIVLVVNNTRDATARIARAEALRLRINLRLLDVHYPAQFGVGEARRRGAECALRELPHLRHLLTTDADCRVAPDWVTRNIHHLQYVDAVCGKVALIASESACLATLDPKLQENEDAYRGLVQEIFSRHAPNCADLRGSHGQTPGASLGFTPEAYCAAGGFEPIPCGEDRHIIRTLRGLGKQVRHADDLRVEASCRLTGRAIGGMADTLRLRLAGGNYASDDCLPRADDLLAQLRAGELPCWPPKVAPDRCVPVQDLPVHMATLRKFLARPMPSQAAAFPPLAPQAPHVPGPQAVYAAPAKDG